LITSNAFYVVLTPSTHGDFIAYVSLLGLYGVDKVPIYLCCWHVLKAWGLRCTKKIKDVEVQDGILQDLHDVMYMSINHGETIDDFKECGRVVVKESLHKHRLNDVWTNYFWTYYL
jgi:hypothetical protein